MMTTTTLQNQHGTSVRQATDTLTDSARGKWARERERERGGTFGSKISMDELTWKGE
jgi:hypothetical protein